MGRASYLHARHVVLRNLLDGEHLERAARE